MPSRLPRPTTTIQVFDDINESHAATGYSGRTDLPTFHIFPIEETYPETHSVMPPYRFGFFQIVMLENSADAALNINAEPINNLNDSVTFASPEHVLTWVRGEAQRGFIVYFKDAFLAHLPARIQDVFPYFRLTEVNDVHPDGEAKARLHDHCARLLATFRHAHPYRVQMLQALLLVLLFDCKHLYEHQAHIARQAAPSQLLTDRFQQLIHQHYLNRKTVEVYAAMLGVSPDYLSHIVKSTTGKGASQHIAERILLEAKKLLVYSDLNIAEIAHYLGYSEPTHFGRFFRRHTELNPLAWRNQHRQIGFE